MVAIGITRQSRAYTKLSLVEGHYLVDQSNKASVGINNNQSNNRRRMTRKRKNNSAGQLALAMASTEKRGEEKTEQFYVDAPRQG